MAPPTKRRKRTVVPSSDEEEDEEDEPVTQPRARPNFLIPSSPLSSDAAESPEAVHASPNFQAPPRKMQPQAKTTANHPPNAAPKHRANPARGPKAGTKSASSSPEKAKPRGRVDDKVRSGNIHSLFAQQARRQQAEGTFRTMSRPKLSVRSAKSSRYEEDDDLISEDDVVESRAPPSSMVGLAARKRARGVEPHNMGAGDPPSASQKFAVPKHAPRTKHAEDTRPWAERFAPANLNELAVHKKKVSDVRAWLEDVMRGRVRQRLLILKGAAGTAKTTTVQLLARDMGCNVLEWRNPVGSVASSNGFLSMSAQFEEFMGRGGKFGQLDIFSADEQVAPKPEAKPLDRRKNLILIEEFPNTFTRSSTALQSFRSTIISYLASNTPPLSMVNHQSKDPITPVVMIISETLLTTASASADSFTTHRLLGPEILQHPGVRTIEFNAIAPTFLTKALELVVQKESRVSGRRTTPGPLVLKKIGEIGDIRSAIGSLEFLCLRGDVDGNWGAKVAFGKTRKTGKDATALTTMEAESLELVTRREASLGIFHAVGKVVHNKREEAAPVVPAGETDVERLPAFMSMHARPKRSQVRVDELIDETGTDTQTFVAALHENYLLSCDAPPTSFEFSSLDHVNGCIDALSDSDLLCPSWDGTFTSSGFGGGGGDVLRQDEICFQIAVRGILFALPSPVQRAAPAAAGLRTGQHGEAFRIFYPTSLKLWRTKEEIESSVDLWATRLARGEPAGPREAAAGAAAFARPGLGSVERGMRPSGLLKAPAEARHTDEGVAPLLSIGSSGRKEMLLERLPYMLTLARSSRATSSSSSSSSSSSWSALAIRQLERVATFRGIGVTSSSEDATAEEAAERGPRVGEEWATDRPQDEGGDSRTRKKGLVLRGKAVAGGGAVAMVTAPEQKLVLSDDDIEDD